MILARQKTGLDAENTGQGVIPMYSKGGTGWREKYPFNCLLLNGLTGRSNTDLTDLTLRRNLET